MMLARDGTGKNRLETRCGGSAEAVMIAHTEAKSSKQPRSMEITRVMSTTSVVRSADPENDTTGTYPKVNSSFGARRHHGTRTGCGPTCDGWPPGPRETRATHLGRTRARRPRRPQVKGATVMPRPRDNCHTTRRGYRTQGRGRSMAW
jgi:hypothetical protein